MIIVLIGESASGKSSLKRAFLESHKGFSPAVQCTTREMRPGEVDGVDYHFISKEYFMDLIRLGEFVEWTEYNGWFYGTKYEEFQKGDVISVLNPPAMRKLRRTGIEFFSVYVKVDRRTRLISILNRGDNIEEAYRRNLTDVGQFTDVSLEVNHVISNERYKRSACELLEELESSVGMQ